MACTTLSSGEGLRSLESRLSPWWEIRTCIVSLYWQHSGLVRQLRRLPNTTRSELIRCQSDRK